MRKVIFLIHTSLDGFVAGMRGEMDWINVDESIFDFVWTITKKTDTALYGRVTYEMMQSYWPTTAEQPNATKHDKEHTAWYKKVSKIILSKTLKVEWLDNTRVISEQLVENIRKIKNEEGKNILIFGSPSASHSLLNEDLIDEFWLFINPILLGNGTPLFKNIHGITQLKLIETKIFNSGVIGLHYEKITR